MIFLTLGTQLPFDRLVRAVDDWCAASSDVEVTAQIIPDETSGYRPRHFSWVTHLNATDYAAKISASKVIVSHAGMGSIISALTYRKPIIILPRKASLGEHRNEHQLATATRFSSRSGIHVAREADDIGDILDRLLKYSQVVSTGIPEFADTRLIETVRAIIQK